MTEENPAAENDQPEEAEEASSAAPSEEGAEASAETESAEETPAAVASSEEGAEGGGEAEIAASEEPPAEPEDPIESLPGVKAVRAFLGEEVGEVTSFTGTPDEVSMVVPSGRIRELCDYLRLQHGFNYLSDLCGVHYPERDRPFEVVYQLFSIDRSELLRLKVRVKDGEPVPSVTEVWRAANWMEREAYDMFGIEFEGHPDLRRILLPEDWEGFPLRKEYPVRGDGFGLTWVERQVPRVSRPVKQGK
jgi:NADH-quinone oxidoreductase subunit C